MPAWSVYVPLLLYSERTLPAGCDGAGAVVAGADGGGGTASGGADGPLAPWNVNPPM